MEGTANTASSPNRLLKGWKEIASFFGRDERTVRRWAAAMDLPVHRVPGRKRAVVYAYSVDLDGWLTGRRDLEAPGGPALGSPSAPPAAEPAFEPAPAPSQFPYPDESGPDEEGIHAALPARKAAQGVASPRSRHMAWRSALATAICVLALAGAGLWTGWPVDPAHKGPPKYRPANGAEALYFDGLYNLETRTAEGLTRAISLFTQAVREDPDYALAYVGLADAYNLVSQYTAVAPDTVYPKARAAAERAIALAPQESGGYAALAFNTFYWQDNFSGSMRLFEQAISLAPDNARAHHWYALVAMQDRRFDLALREIAQAQKLDPKAPSILANKGLILFHAGRTDEALAVLRPLAVTNPSLRSPAAYLATIYLSIGRDGDFLREFRRSAMLSGSADELAIAEAAEAGYDKGGRQEMLLAMLSRQRDLYEAGRYPAFRLALTAAMLGDSGLTFDYLTRSIQNKEPEIKGILLEPALSQLHGDRQFNVMIAEAGLSPETGP
jgi:tetratricopeptide (TPR) repeat protein